MWRTILSSLIAAVAIATCGGQDRGGADADPAERIPGASVLYFELDVRPGGEQQDSLTAVAQDLIGSDDIADAVIDRLNQFSTAEDVSYEEDFEPWLGDRFAAAVVPVQSSYEVVVTASVVDRDGAEEFAEYASGGTGNDYRGSTYFGNDDGSTYGVIGDHFVFAQSPEAFQLLVDTEIGESLSAAEAYRSRLACLPQERTGLVYLDLSGLSDFASAFGQTGKLLGARLLAKQQPSVAALLAEPGQLVIESRGPSAPLSPFRLTGATPLVREAPGASAQVLGQPRTGAFVRSILKLLPGGVDRVSAPLRRGGLDLERDLLTWLGDTAWSTPSSDPNDLRVSVLMEVRGPVARARAAVVRIANSLAGTRPLSVPGNGFGAELALPGQPPFVLLHRDRRVVLASGREQALETLDPPQPFGQTETYRQAREATQGKPAFVLDTATVEPILQLFATDQGILYRTLLDRAEVFALGEDQERRRLAIRF